MPTWMRIGRNTSAPELSRGSAMSHLLAAARTTPANLIAPANYSQIIWAVFIGMLFFNETPDAWTITGIVLVIALRHHDADPRRNALRLADADALGEEVSVRIYSAATLQSAFAARRKRHFQTVQRIAHQDLARQARIGFHMESAVEHVMLFVRHRV